MQQPPEIQPKKRGRRKFFAIGCGGLIVLVVLIAVIAAAANSGSNSTSSTNNAATYPTAAPTQPPAEPTVQPTSAPTQTPAQVEAAYKASTTNMTVANLDKDGATNQGADVHFTATILNFVKDSTGTTAGANVNDPNNAGSVIQVLFPAGTDLSQLNQGDSLEVWGTDEGVFSGTNAFGATIQEVGIAVQYMTDQTTNYQANM